jgi:adenylate cyclase
MKVDIASTGSGITETQSDLDVYICKADLMSGASALKVAQITDCG